MKGSQQKVYARLKKEVKLTWHVNIQAGFHLNLLLPPIGNNCRQFCTSLV
jgi:hypothetical protein